MRIRFSFFHKHTILGLTLLLSFSPNYASSEEHNPNSSAVFAGDCARNTAGRLEIETSIDGLLRDRGTNDEQDKVDEGRKKDELKTGRMAAVCELMFGASVWDSLSPMLQSFSTRDRLKKLDTYKALMAADKITQQALVKDYLKTLFDMDAEGISAGMALLAAQEKKQEEKEKEAAAKKKAADDAFAVFDISGVAARAAIKRAADDAVNKQLKNGGNIDTKQMNTQTYVDENGNKGTLWCNPGPCTLGSATKHGWISGAGTLLPEELVGAVTKILTRDSETSSSAIRSEIFDITLKTFIGAAETSDDAKLKSAAAMSLAQIKSNQVAFKSSQEDKAPVEEAPAEEAPVLEAPVLEAPVEEAPVLEAPVVEAPVEEDHHHDDGTEAPVDEGTEAPVEEWDDDCLGMEQCNIPIVR